MYPARVRRLQLLQLLLLLCSLHRRTLAMYCPNHTPNWPEKGEIMEQAGALFDIEVCGPDGLQWSCYIRQECVHPKGGSPDFLVAEDSAEIKAHPCPAVFAIQARTENQWRVVMQAKDVAPGEKVVFNANCWDEFECWAEGTKVKGRAREKRGRYEPSGALGTLLCDFVITSKTHKKIEMIDGPRTFTGIVTPRKEGGEGRELSSRFGRDAYNKIRAGCDLSIVVRALPVASVNDEVEYKPVNIDYNNFTCPETYTMRWRDTKLIENNKAPFNTTPGIFCIKGANGGQGVIKVVESDPGGVTRSAQLDVHCARKKCKHCLAPNCSNSNLEACPQLIKFDDFDTCPKLKCKDKQLQLRFGGKVHSGEALCNDGKWMVDGDVMQDVDCFKPAPCPNAAETIRTKDAENFNFTDDRIACKNEAEDIKYLDGKDTDRRMTAIVCNFSTGGTSQWYEKRKDSEFAPEPYMDGTIDCYEPPSKPEAPASANVLLFTGIGFVVLAAIIGVILVICLMGRQKRKKKAREAALKMAATGSKSKESKLLSPRSKSTMSRVTSTRSATGNTKKKTDGKGGKTPDDKTPEERSRPVGRSSIVDTAELEKIEEERRKTAAATAALLESSKVEDEPQPVPATGAGSGEVPVEMSKGSASLIPDATQQPEPPIETPKLKTLQKKRLKKSKILENTDFTQQATVSVDKTQMPTASTQGHSMAVSKTQLGGPESDDEPETPLWHNQPTVAISADKKEEPPAAAASDRQKISDLPTAKKKDSTKKAKSGKRTSSAEKIVRPNYINDTSDWEADFTSSSKKNAGPNGEEGGSKESEKDERSKRTQRRDWARKTSARIPVDLTQPPAEENNN
ncbi:hypothetical protein PRIPAC_91269 [Pristionchus pacificus]|uniref:Uncharacterized protein n=1 Tax=Pristionchus pacificus TaxID=54126 RepID=A0A2A6B3W7_PRIPA|nr:hypothetical protein PRIPAC_91269 [Pristionchus pacificus]|eukprot:PDM60564.1 hypothetical protein PRIPAC_53542 [Pristionchus pacificus]